MDNSMFIKPVVYAVPGMEGAEVRRDVVYHSLEDGTELTMDVYLPPGLAEGERRPGVVFVHGGPVPEDKWHLVKNWGLFNAYGRMMAASGMVGVAFNNRFLGLDRIADPAANIAAALAFVRGQADSLHLDPDRLCVWVFSGGGPFLSPLLIEKPAWARCLVAYYALFDLRPVRDRIPGGLSDELLERFSPVACLAGESFEGPPILVARAGLDQPWLNATTDAFVARALAVNATIDVLNHPRGQHGFDVLDDDDRSREILARTLDFVKAHV